jgi:hypothetical protein
LGTVAGSTQPGGRALIVVDAASSRHAPALVELRGQSGDALRAFAAEARAAGTLALRPDPADLSRQLSAPGLAALVSDLSLEEPWLWHTDADTRLVYALRFAHPAG